VRLAKEQEPLRRDERLAQGSEPSLVERYGLEVVCVEGGVESRSTDSRQR
jgi:hypothetical protein